MTKKEDRDPTEAEPVDGYEAPSIEVLGAVAELTQTVQGSLDV